VSSSRGRVPRVAHGKETDVSTNELAGRFGISAATVNGYLVRRGVPIRRNSAREERHGRGGRHRDKTTGYVRVRVQPDDWLYRHSTNIKAVCGCCGSSDIGYVPLT
jgi:hypothetical protein